MLDATYTVVTNPDKYNENPWIDSRFINILKWAGVLKEKPYIAVSTGNIALCIQFYINFSSFKMPNWIEFIEIYYNLWTK